MSNTQWYVALVGEAKDLEELRQRLQSSEIRVVKVENEYRLHWPRFDGLATDAEVLASAETAVALLNMAGTLRIDSFQPIKTGAVIEVHSDGSVQHFERVAYTIRTQVSFDAAVIRADGTRETIQPEGLEYLLSILESSTHIERALHYVLHEPNWYGYYKAFEAIRDCVGNHNLLVKRRWFTGAEISRFTGSANPERHHKKRGHRNPMTEREGRAFALALIERAIAEILSTHLPRS